MTTSPAIEIAGLTKSYGDAAVLRGVDLSVPSGTVLALLGANGAGKTAVVRILSTLLAGDGGTAAVHGHDVRTEPARVRGSISLTGQFAAVDEVLTGRENLVLVARLRHLGDAGAIADDLLARFGLTDAGGRRVATYSGGMRRRLALPPEAVAYLERMRELGFRERLIEVERDSWILIAAQIPDQVPALMAIKHAQIEHEVLRRLYLDIGDLADTGPDDPRLPELADRVAAFITAAEAEAREAETVHEHPISDDLVALLDAAFVESFPCAPRLLELLEERGWVGWTNIRRADPPA